MNDSRLRVTVVWIMALLLFLAACDAAALRERATGIRERALPGDGLPDTLLPVSVGRFTRLVLEIGPEGGVLAIYDDGKDVIQVRADVFADADFAGEMVAYVDGELRSLSYEPQAAGIDPAYTRASGTDWITGAEFARMAWSHDRFFFDVTASSDADLNRFLDDFPY